MKLVITGKLRNLGNSGWSIDYLGGTFWLPKSYGEPKPTKPDTYEIEVRLGRITRPNGKPATTVMPWAES